MATDTTHNQTDAANNASSVRESDIDHAQLTQSAGAVQVQVPQGQNVVRVQVTPGETVELPFPSDGLVARLGDNGNLAVKVGDVTVILVGYADAVGQGEITIVGNDGKSVDVAAVLAATDPNLDIQTAAGPGAGDQGAGPDNNGGLFSPFDPLAGIGGLNAIGGLDPTQLQYNLIQNEYREIIEADEVDTTPVVVSITQAPPVNEDDFHGWQSAENLIDRLNPRTEESGESARGEQSFSPQQPLWTIGKFYDDGNDPFDTKDHEEGSQTDYNPNFGTPGQSDFFPWISDDNNGPWWGGIDQDREPLSVSATVEANFFADLPGKLVLDANGNGINDGPGDVPLIDQLQAMNLTSHGHELTYMLLPEVPESAPGQNDGQGQMVVAYYTVMHCGQPLNVVVFTIGVDDDVVNAGETNLAGNAEFDVSFTIYGVLDHPEKNVEDILNIKVPFFLQDSDSPPVPGTFPEGIVFQDIDDKPFLGDVCYVSVPCLGDVPIAIHQADLTIGHDESADVQHTDYDTNGWFPGGHEQTDDTGSPWPIWSADWKLDGIGHGYPSGENVDISYQQGILSKLDSQYLHGGNFCAQAIGSAKTYLDVSFGADGKAKGNDQAGKTLFNQDSDTDPDNSEFNYNADGTHSGDAAGTDKHAFELFMHAWGSDETTINTALTNWTIMVDGCPVQVWAYQLDANTIIGMASPPDEGQESFAAIAEQEGGQHCLTGQGNDIPVFMLTLNPDTGELTFVQYHQINNYQGGSAANPDWDGSANDPIQLLDIHGKPLVYFQATDFDGDSVTAQLQVSVIDDAPSVGSNAKIQLDDDDVVGGWQGNPGDAGSGTDDVQANTTGTLSHNYGTDGAGSTLFTGANVPAGFSAQVFDGGKTLIIFQGFTPVVKLELSDSTSGSYKATQLNPIHHASGNNENNVEFTVNYKVTDADGDYVNGSVKVNVDDDTPVAQICHLENNNVLIDETWGNQGGTDDENNPAWPFGAIGFNPIEWGTSNSAIVTTFGSSYGEDGPGSISLSIQPSANGVVSGIEWKDGSGVVQDVKLYQQGDLVVGKVGNTVVFAVAIDQNGKVSVAQYQPIYHNPNNGPNNGPNDVESILNDALQVKVTVKDGDNDIATKSVGIGSSIDFRDDAPSVDCNQVVKLEDDDVPNKGGIDGGPGDDPAPDNASGTLSHSYGTDGAGTTLLTGVDGLPAGFSAAVSNGGTTLIITQIQDGNPVEVLKIQLSNDTGGIYTVIQLAPIDHSHDGTNKGNWENNVEFNVKYEVTDNDGDKAQGTLEINVDDDSPELSVGTIRNAADKLKVELDETVGADRYASGESPDGGNIDDVPGALAQKTTNVNGGLAALFTIGGGYGADGAGTTTGVLKFTGIPSGGLPTNLQANDGGAITLKLDSPTKITGYDQQGNAVFTIEIVGGPGNYQLQTTQFESIEHTNTGKFDDVAQLLLTQYGKQVELEYTVTRTDGDGDTVTDSAKIGLISKNDTVISFDDDGPKVGETVQWTVDEDSKNFNNDGSNDDGLPGGIQDGPGDDSGGTPDYIGFAGKSLNIDYGSDGPATNPITFLTTIVAKDANGTPMTLKSGGVDVVLSWAGDVLTGKAGGVTVFELTVHQNTGTIDFQLKAPIDHPWHDADYNNNPGGSEYEDMVRLEFGFTAKDGDGDSVPGKVVINVNDDSPDACCLDAVTIKEVSNVVLVPSEHITIDPGHTNNAMIQIRVQVPGDANASLNVNQNESGVDAWGVTSSVDGSDEARFNEINYLGKGPGDTSSEVMIFELQNDAGEAAAGKYAVSASVEMNVFFGQEGSVGDEVGTYELYRDGVKVAGPVPFVALDGSGHFTLPISFPAGFDAIYFAALPGTTDGNGNQAGDSSDYNVKSVTLDLVTEVVTPTEIKGTVCADFGADGPAADGGIALAVENGGHTSVFHNGVEVINQVSFDGNTIVGMAGGVLVWQLTINDATKEYTFKLFQTIDGETDPTIEFRTIVTDRDGDQDPGCIKVTIDQNDVPTLTVSYDQTVQAKTGLVDEDHLSNGNKDLPAASTGDDPGSNSASCSGHYDANFKSDAPGTVAINAVENSPTGLQTLNGDPVLWHVVNGNQAVGYVGNIANVVFTISLSGPNPSANGDGTWQFVLKQPLKHDGIGTEDNVNVSIPLIATDSNGDTATGQINVSIDDDMPYAADDGAYTVTNVGAGNELSGNVLTGAESQANGVNGADMVGADGAKISEIKLENGNWVSVGDAGVDIPTGGIGSLHINPDGSWYFDQTGSSQQTFNFTYRLKDGDGDVDEATFSITTKQTYNKPSFELSQVIVDEDGLNDGQGGKPDGANPDLNNQNGTDDLVGGHSSNSEAVYNGQVNVNWGGDTGTLAVSILPSELNNITLHDGTHPVVSGSSTAQHLVLVDGQGNAVLEVNIANVGNYQVVLHQSIEHSAGGNENQTDQYINVKVTAHNSAGDTSHDLNITIDDDMPIVTGETVSVTEETSGGKANVLFILDVTGSMNTVDPGNSKSRLELAKEAVIATALKYFTAAGDPNVRFELATFGATGVVHGATWMTYDQLVAAVNAASTISNTNYDVGLLTGMNAFNKPGKLTDAANVSFFVSDGEPNQGSNADGFNNDNGPSGSTSGDRGIGANEQAAWESFLNTNDILSYAIGIGPDAVSGNALLELSPIAYDGRGAGSDPAGLVIPVANVANLETVLGDLVSGGSSTGNLLVNDQPGADGWATQAISKITFNLVDYLPNANGVITVVTPAGTLTVYGKDYNGHAAGEYLFEAGSVNANTPLSFTYTTVDDDGDGVTGTLAITVQNKVIPNITVDDALVVEGGQVFIKVKLSEAAAGPVTVKLNTQNGTATGGDFNAIVNTTVSFAAGETEKLVPLQTNNDSTYEVPEQLSVLLSAANGGVITDGTGVVTIVDNDIPNPASAPGSYGPGATDTLTNNDYTNNDTTYNDDSFGGTTSHKLIDGESGGHIINASDGNDWVQANNGNDTLNGGDGNDYLDGGTGFDKYGGGSGNDTMLIDLADMQSNSRSINGGDGDDMLDLSAVSSWDFQGSGTNSGHNGISNIEVINLEGSGNHTITLDAQSVIDMADTENTLFIRAETSGDVVNLSDATGTWNSVANDVVGTDGRTYDVFQATVGGSTATVYVDNDLGANLHLNT